MPEGSPDNQQQAQGSPQPIAAKTTSPSGSATPFDQYSSDQTISSEAAEGQTTIPIQSILKKDRVSTPSKKTVQFDENKNTVHSHESEEHALERILKEEERENSEEQRQQHEHDLEGKKGKGGLLAWAGTIVKTLSQAGHKLAKMLGLTSNSTSTKEHADTLGAAGSYVAKASDPQSTVTPKISKMEKKLQHEGIKYSQRQAQGLGGKESQGAAKEGVEKTSEPKGHVEKLTSSRETNHTRGG